MLFSLLTLFAIGLVAFWIDQDNMEEMHILVIVGLILLGLILISMAPWEIQLGIILIAFMPKLFFHLFHYLHKL